MAASIGGCTSSKRKATSREACHCWRIPSQVVLQSLPLDLLPQDHWMPFRVRFSLQTIQWRMPVSSRIIAWINIHKINHLIRICDLECLHALAFFSFMAYLISLHCELWIRLAWPMTATKSWSGKVKTNPHKTTNEPPKRSTLVFIPWTPGCLASGYNSPYNKGCHCFQTKINQPGILFL